jgi:thiamine transport system substrate-binding protein
VKIRTVPTPRYRKPSTKKLQVRLSTIFSTTFMAAFGAFFVAGCGSDSDKSSPRTSTLTLLAYESFTMPPEVFAPFTAETGITVNVALSGDAGELISKAALTAGNPEGDVLWGVDNTLLSRAIEAEIFDPYTSSTAPVDDALIKAGAQAVTPVDFGHVCVNYDIADLKRLELEPPTSFNDLIDSAYRGLLVVQNPALSSPGLAFLLATVARYGDNWTEYWQKLVANDVLVVDGWSDAYYSSFTKYGGDRPLVVSYSTSPPAEVLFADPPLPPNSPAPTGVVIDTCFEQIEFAGVLRGSKDISAARLLVDFLVSRTFQEALPENLFVYPVNRDAVLPQSFISYAPEVVSPIRLTADEIATGRQEWIDMWTSIVLS